MSPPRPIVANCYKIHKHTIDEISKQNKLQREGLQSNRSRRKASSEPTIKPFVLLTSTRRMAYGLEQLPLNAQLAFTRSAHRSSLRRQFTDIDYRIGV